jgi:hypothetical protein
MVHLDTYVLTLCSRVVSAVGTGFPNCKSKAEETKTQGKSTGCTASSSQLKKMKKVLAKRMVFLFCADSYYLAQSRET